MTLTKIFTGMSQGPEKIDANFTDLNGRIPDLGNYYNKSEVDSKITSTDTGWVPVSFINGWGGKVNVRLKDGVVYHNGYLVPSSMTNAAAFKYPDSFGDMSVLDNFGRANSAWVSSSNSDITWGYVEGGRKLFCCPYAFGKTSDMTITISNIVFKL